MRTPDQSPRYEPVLADLLGCRLVGLRRALRRPEEGPGSDGATELTFAATGAVEPVVLQVLYDDDEECLVPRLKPIQPADLSRTWRVVDLLRDPDSAPLLAELRNRRLRGVRVLARREQGIDFDVVFSFDLDGPELSIGLVGPSTDCVVSLGVEEWLGGREVGPVLELPRRKDRSS